MVVRVNKTKDYTVMSNRHLMDRRLSLKAKGLLSVVLSLPEDWEYSVSGLASISREKETSIKSALSELKEYGYLIITKKMPNQTTSGRIEYEWDFYECSCRIGGDSFQETKKQGVEKQRVENLTLEFLTLENQGQLNTNISNTNKENTKGIDILDKPKKPRFIPPTLEQVQEYCDERGNDVDAQRFFEYYQAGGWKDAKGNPVRNWKQKVITWEKKSYGKPINQGGRKSGNEFLDLLNNWEDEDE